MTVPTEGGQNTNNLIQIPLLQSHLKNHSNPLTPGNLSVFNLNVESLRNKLNMLEAFLVNCKPQPQIACICEHWLSKGEENYCNLSNYSVASSRSRSNKVNGITYGGVLIYLNKQINYNILNLETLSKDSICELVGIKLLDFNILIICIYRTPEPSNFQQFLSSLDQVLSTYGLNNKVCICGDVNVKLNLHQDRETVAFMSLVTSHGFVNTVTTSTRGRNCIDNVFINFNKTEFSSAVYELGFSDHCAQLVKIPNCVGKVPFNKEIKIRPITDENKLRFRNIVQELDWSFIHDDTRNAQSKFEIFQNILSDASKIAFMEKTIKINYSKKASSISFTPELKQLRKNLLELSNLFKTNPSEDLAERKKVARKLYRNALSIAKKQANDNRIAQSGNPNKTAWEIINQNNKKANEAECSKITPEEFNRNFSEAPLAIVNSLSPSEVNPLDLVTSVDVQHVDEEFSLQPVTTMTVSNAMASLAKKKGRDIYNLNLDIILSIQDLITPVLVALINLCFQKAVFPDCLKTSLIRPVFKKGAKSQVSNYRPISILPILGKIIEKIISNQITQYITYYNLLSPSQFGFRKQLSTTDAVRFFNNFIANGFNNSTYLYAILCDLSRAFETLDHDILLQKLSHYKFQDSSVQFIKSYLENRIHRVIIGDVLSTPQRVNAGIPTGSILGPLIFLIYINDLPSNLPSYANATIFADDSTVTVDGENEQEAIGKGEIALAQAQVWFDSNRLHLNRSKTQSIVISLRPVTQHVNPASVKLLGFHVDQHLNWQIHINNISNLLSSRIFLLRRLQNEVSLSVLKNCYYGLIHSIISYGIVLWGHTSASRQLFIIQKSAIRILGKAKYREHAKPLFQKLKILTLPSLYILNCLISVKSHMHEYHTFQSVHSHDTRNKRNLVPARHRVNAARNGTNYYGILFFNKLPPSIQDLPEKAFKSYLQDFLERKAFYSTNEFLTSDLGVA